jgi:hypothetical protein
MSGESSIGADEWGQDIGSELTEVAEMKLDDLRRSNTPSIVSVESTLLTHLDDFPRYGSAEPGGGSWSKGKSTTDSSSSDDADGPADGSSSDDTTSESE